jgi:phenylacetate-CoA ligase
MHLNIEHLFIEVLTPAGKPCAPGEEGKIVVTDLVNRSMPIIRYRVEDVGVLSAQRCACGRGQPLLDKLVGRTADYLRKVDGSQVAGVSLVERTLTAIPGIEQMQIVQPELRKIVLNVVPAADYTAATEAALVAEFQQVFGADTQFNVQRVEKIPQERSGKYRFSICQISD